MKNMKLASIAILLSLMGCSAYPYAMMNSKNSNVHAVAYVFKDINAYTKYLEAQGVPDKVIQYATTASNMAPAVGAALAAETAGASLVVAEALPIAVQAVSYIHKALTASGIEGGLMRKAAGIIAVHWNIPPGNQGRGAEWNWASIQQQYGVPQGGTLFVVITDAVNGQPLLQSPMISNARFGFVINKDATGKTTASISNDAANEYVPAN